ncbi:MAG: hypothetical protein U0T74_15520 [Chitinophagales bacterium]
MFQTFLRVYVLLLLAGNVIGLCWAFQPQAIGLYVAMLWVPVNFAFALVGLVWLLWFSYRTTKRADWWYYVLVIVLPVVLQVLVYQLVSWLTPKGGC